MTRGFGPETVIEGLDGYLFHRDHEVVEQVTGELPLSDSLLAAWVRATIERMAWCEERGIGFRFLIVPEKHAVLAHKLPGMGVSARRPAAALLAALPEAALGATLYPVDLLRRIDAVGSYLLNDSHWTDAGALAVLSALLATLPERLVGPRVSTEGLGVQVEHWVGDLGRRLDPPRGEDRVRLFHDPPRPFRQTYYNGLTARGSTIVYEGDPAGRRIVMFRDSFATSMIPHLIPSFSRTVCVSSIHVHRDLVEAEAPDVVILEVAERFLGNYDSLGERPDPTDPDPPSFEALAGVPPSALPPTPLPSTSRSSPRPSLAQAIS